MAEGTIAKLIKLNCMIKRWKQRSSSSSSGKPSNNNMSTTTNVSWKKKKKQQQKQQETKLNHLQPPTSITTSDEKEDPLLNLQPVYVGRSRRRYLVSSQLVDHPLFRVLVLKSGEEKEEEEKEVVVGCEVVMFEHLLWMLKNNVDDGETRKKESIEELVRFYSSF